MTLMPVDLAIAALGGVREATLLEIVPGGHVDACVTGFDTSSTAVLE